VYNAAGWCGFSPYRRTVALSHVPPIHSGQPVPSLVSVSTLPIHDATLTS
jgi:hypothetical protein